MYYLLDWKETPEGKAANLPQDVDYMMLAEPSSVSDYALFECSIPDENEESEHLKPVSHYLHDLLESAKTYPPALALTRNKVQDTEILSKSDFAEKLVASLEFYLEHQPFSPYFMARKINRHVRWNSKGGFRWITGYNPQDSRGNITFASDDYYLCHGWIEDFEIEITEIEKRFAK